jgi:hypothetical protein
MGTGLFALKKNSKWGLRHAKGEQLLPFEYDAIEIVWTVTGACYLQKGGLWGVYIGDTIQIPFIYDKIEDKSKRFFVEKDGKHGILNIDGKVFVPAQYDKIDHYEDSRGLAKRDGQWFVIEDGIEQPDDYYMVFQYPDVVPTYGDFDKATNNNDRQFCSVKALNQFFQDNVEYPEEAIKQKIDGAVTLEFTVTSTGEVRDMIMRMDINGIFEGTCKEGLQLAGKWNQTW